MLPLGKMSRTPSVEPAPWLAELRNIYATAPVGLCCIDCDLRYVSVNDRLAEWNGRPSADHIGRTLREVIPQVADLVEPVYRRVFDTGEPELGVELRGVTDASPDVERTWVCHYSPVRDRLGRVVAVNTVVHDVTDRMAWTAALNEVTESLRQRDEFLHVVGDRLPQAMLFRLVHSPDGDYRFTYVSEGAADVIGRTAEEILREPQAVIDRVADEDRPFVLEAMATSIRTLAPLDLTCRMRWPDGSRHWCHFRSAVRTLEDGSVICEGIILNTTREKLAEQALFESQARNQAILSALPDMMFVFDTNSTYLDVHTRDEALLLVPPSAFLGRTIAEVMPPDLARQFARCFDQVALEGSSQTDYSLTVDGERRYFEARMVPCGPDKVLAIVRDVTDSKRTQVEVERSRLELAHISRITMLGEIAASLAHELNQPLTAILANSEAARYSLIAKRVDGLEVDAMLADVVEGAKRAGDVIRRVRTWLTRGQFEPEETDINQKIHDVVRLLHSELIMRHVRVTVDLDPSLPLVFADRVQIQQVIMNLALNGIEAMHERPVGDRQLTFSTSWIDGSVQVAVRDRGTGMQPDHMERLFDPFFSTKAAGLGMGLRICSSIVAAHGGRIWASNSADVGATFFFTLPAVRPA